MWVGGYPPTHTHTLALPLSGPELGHSWSEVFHPGNDPKTHKEVIALVDPDGLRWSQLMGKETAC